MNELTCVQTFKSSTKATEFVCYAEKQNWNDNISCIPTCENAKPCVPILNGISILIGTRSPARIPFTNVSGGEVKVLLQDINNFNKATGYNTIAPKLVKSFADELAQTVYAPVNMPSSMWNFLHELKKCRHLLCRKVGNILSPRIKIFLPDCPNVFNGSRMMKWVCI